VAPKERNPVFTGSVVLTRHKKTGAKREAVGGGGGRGGGEGEGSWCVKSVCRGGLVCHAVWGWWGVGGVLQVSMCVWGGGGRRR